MVHVFIYLTNNAELTLPDARFMMPNVWGKLSPSEGNLGILR